jgi:hypothetical protein
MLGKTSRVVIVDRFDLKLRESYMRFVKTWICIANPWICKDSDSRIWTFKDSIRGSLDESELKKIRFVSQFMNPVNFQRFDLFS